MVYYNLAQAQETIKVGKEAPDFTIKLLQGGSFTLSEQRGKGVIVNFWATYCPPCIREMPAIERQYQKYKEQGLVVIGVNTGEGRVTVQGYVNRLGVTYPIGLDPNFEVTNLYKTDPLPRTIFIDPEGKVKNVILGEMKETTIEENIAQILPK